MFKGGDVLLKGGRRGVGMFFRKEGGCSLKDGGLFKGGGCSSEREGGLFFKGKGGWLFKGRGEPRLELKTR